MKLIFLDIDGVIKEDRHGTPFLDGSLKVLADIVRETDARLVMSSTWKVKYKAFIDNGFKTEYNDICVLYHTLKKYGLSIYGYTPYFGNIDKPLRRPAEIAEYLKNNGDAESFCILDDRDEFIWGELSDHLVLTYLGKSESGEKIAHLAPEHKSEIIEILNKSR